MDVGIKKQCNAQQFLKNAADYDTFFYTNMA